MPRTFADLGVSRSLADTLKQTGVVTPTPVQREAIPVLLAGDDAIVQAQTGTGKTLAFALPILEKIDTGLGAVQALVVTPTRELAIQITKEFKKLAPEDIGILAAYGGQDVESQLRKLSFKIHLVVGTPGRLLDHIRRESIRLYKVSMLVLDEADQMLHMGFLAEVEEVIAQTPESRQTMLFSATMPGNVKRLAARYMRQPKDIRIAGEHVTLDEIRQFVVDTTDRAKQATLIRLIEVYRPYLAVVFCRTKIRAKKLNEALIEHGIDADELHGDLTQAKREQVMKRFRAAKLQILVATDVAARGIDVEGVTHVFNYDMPLDAESYIHRIGRTGRAGQAGTAITLASPRDRLRLMEIERGIGAKLEHRTSASYQVDAGADAGDDRDDVRGPRSGAAREGAGGRRDGAARGRRDREDGARTAAAGRNAGAARGRADGTAGTRTAAAGRDAGAARGRGIGVAGRERGSARGRGTGTGTAGGHSDAVHRDTGAVRGGRAMGAGRDAGTTRGRGASGRSDSPKRGAAPVARRNDRSSGKGGRKGR